MNTYAKVVCLLAATFVILVVNGASGPEPLQEISDHKDFKKILRTKTNVMVLFVESVKSARPLITTCQEVAEKVKGTGSIFLVNCGSEGKKLCKKLKVAPEPSVLKHYKDGDFHKDYDRKENVQSLSNFMRDPTGDIPWEEESNTEDIVHLADPVSLSKYLKPSMKPMLLMAYAPWCKFCKILKPEYAAAAKELKNTAVLAAMDVTRAENSIVSKYLNVTGFPTLIYFEGGEAKHRYEGENTKDGIVAFVRNPVAAPPKSAEQEWSDVSKDVVHLGVEDFDPVLEGQNSALVMFYAPWCGHCKRMKPELDSAAKTMKEEGIDGILAAVDVTKHRSLGERYGVTGYPTLKYFKKGEVAFEAGNVPDVRKAAGIVAFMKDPQEPPPPPPPEKAWSESDGNVVHLTEESFKGFLKKKKHVLVMFYAPWCGHCKAMKPAFEEAAGKFVDNPKVEYAAVDCTQHGKICNQYGVTGYPTVKYFSYFDKDEKNYHEGRNVDSFVNYMNDLLGVPRSGEPAKKAPPKDDFDWASVSGGSDVKVLTEDNFEEELKASGNTLVMYFAPWCGHCKAMKADYAAAAAELKSKGLSKVSLAAVDCTQERSLMSKAEVRGFPTLKFYRGTEIAFEYDGERTKEALVSFALDPKPKQQKKASVDDGNNGFDWSSLPGGEDVKVLTEGNFKEALEGLDGALVMFYAPWCGHCKSMKEAFARAAKTVKTKSGSKQIALAAVDCTVERSLVQDHGIRGFPTLKYFKKGTFALDYKGPRSKDALASFALDPEKAKDEEKLKEKKMADEFDWKSIPGGEAVLTLTNQNFEKLKQVEGALVMYYAPWCGHCKSMKSDYAEAAGSLEKLGINNFKLAAVDCTVEQDLAEKAGIRSFPTLKYYVKGEYISDYRRGRKKDELVSFAKNPPQPDSKQEEFWKGVPGEEAVLKLNGQDFFPELKKHEGALVMFYSPGCRRCEEAKTEFAQAASDLKLNEITTYVFASVDTEVSGELAKLTLSGTRVPPPNLLYFHHGEHLKDYSGPARRKDFVDFALGTVEKTGKKEDSSQEDSAEKVEEFKWNAFPGGKDVKVLNGDNYEEELKKYDAAVVFFRAPGCRHCRAMQRDYAFAAQMLKEKRAANVVLATVDGHEEPELVKRLGVEGYPSLWVYRKGVHVNDHHGDRTYQKFVEVVLEEAGKVEKTAKEEL